jgi:hypothetical protein
MTSFDHSLDLVTNELHTALAAVDEGQLAPFIDVLASTNGWF